MERQLMVWPSPAAGTARNLESLGRQALAVGGRKALAEHRSGDVAHVHGERHDLWWEFSLEASFRWQAHLCRLRPEVYQQRLYRLTRGLGLEGLLDREVAGLTHTTRALADLAVALLVQPKLLLWEEPFYMLGQGDAARAARLLRELHAEGMGLVAVAKEAPGLADLEAAPSLLHLAR